MILKAGVKIRGLQPEALLGMILADQALGGCVITSVTEGKHMAGSKHYQGQGFDVRLRTDYVDGGYALLAKTLTPLGFDVVKEVDHIHCEYDPKEVK